MASLRRFSAFYRNRATASRNSYMAMTLRRSRGDHGHLPPCSAPPWPAPRRHRGSIEVEDAGRLGDNVGGQGIAWNQPLKKAHYVFGYPQAAHPDGNKPFTGVTPKRCYGTTTAKTGARRPEVLHDRRRDGGPWLPKYRSSKRVGYLNGVTSSFYDQDENDREARLTEGGWAPDSSHCAWKGQEGPGRAPGPSAAHRHFTGRPSSNTHPGRPSSRPCTRPARTSGPSPCAGPTAAPSTSSSWTTSRP